MSDIKELLKTVKELEVRTKGLVDGIVSGSYKSKIRGRGIEFSEVREYSMGDDIRRIDWNVTARTKKLHVKEFVEERDLYVYVLFDYSASNEFGFHKSKKLLGSEIAASIIFSAMKNNDNIGLGIFTDKLEQFIPAKKGRKHSLKLLRELIVHQPESKKTDINKSLSQVHNILKQHCVIFVISDYISSSFLKPLKFLRNRHDIILVNLSDIREIEIPNIGYVMLEDMETGEQTMVNTSDKVFQRDFQRNVQNESSVISKEIRNLKVEMIGVSEKEPFELTLRKFFNRRMRYR